MSLNILLTGGMGFIGKNILESIQDKYSVFAPTHAELDIMNRFLLDDYIKKKQIDIIIHTAVGKGKTLFEDTLLMFGNIMSHMDKVEKIIFFGSGAEYSKKRNLIKVSEIEIGGNIPEDSYGLAKLFSSELARSARNVVNLRLFGVFGKYEDYKIKFISNSMVKALLDIDISIAQNVIFDYLYIDDLVRIVHYFIENDSDYSDYNITPTESISLIEITDIIRDVANKKVDVTVLNDGMNYQYTASNERLIGFIPDFTFTPYKEAINQLKYYYTQNIEHLDRIALNEDAYLKRSLKNAVIEEKD
jgi:UDP-glucose 4-epimerase